MTTGVILSGGRSTRMGRDKALLPFRSGTMLGEIVHAVRAVASEIVIVARADQEIAIDDVTIVRDPVPDEGPLVGMASGLAAASGDVAIVLACDMPLIRPPVLQRLIDWLGASDACVAEIDGRPSPLCAAYRTSVAATASDLVAGGERRVMALLDVIQTKRVDAAHFRDVDPMLESFISCDTPDAYERARLGTET